MTIRRHLALVAALGFALLPCTSFQAGASTPKVPTALSTVSLAMVFNYNVPTDQVLAAEQAASVPYVWGASQPEPSGGTAWHDYYIRWAQGFCPDGNGVPLYDLQCPSGAAPSDPWLVKNHPDWILWQTNSKGVPTVIAHNAGDPGPILDFTNPAVQQFWLKTYVLPALAAGYNGIAWDEPTTYNTYGAVGHWDVKHKKFTKLYSGKATDQAWVTAQAKALGQILKLTKQSYPQVQFSLNASLDCSYASAANWALPLASVTTIADEEGYSYWGNNNQWLESSPGQFCHNRWLQKTEEMIAYQKAGKKVLTIDAAPFTVTPGMTATNPTARAAVQWDLANYLMIKYTNTYLWFGHYQDYGNPVVTQPEFFVNMGKALGDMTYTSNVYERSFADGLAVVNPSQYKTFTVTFPKNKYQTLYGKVVNSVAMTPHSGMVLELKGGPIFP